MHIYGMPLIPQTEADGYLGNIGTPDHITRKHTKYLQKIIMEFFRGHFFRVALQRSIKD